MSRSVWGLIGGAGGWRVPEVAPPHTLDEPEPRMPIVTPRGRIAFVPRSATEHGPLMWQEPLDALHPAFGPPRHPVPDAPGVPVVLNVHGYMGPWGNDLYRLDLAAEVQPREMEGFLLALLHLVAPDVVSKSEGGHLHGPFGPMVFVDGRWRHRG